MSWIEVRIVSEEEARSQLVLTHICPIDDHWEKYGPGAGGIGWDLSLLGLEAYLSNRDFTRSDGQALMASEELKTFMVGANEDWGQAAIVAGENPAQAKAAAKRNIAFYMGEES